MVGRLLWINRFVPANVDTRICMLHRLHFFCVYLAHVRAIPACLPKERCRGVVFQSGTSHREHVFLCTPYHRGATESQRNVTNWENQVCTGFSTQFAQRFSLFFSIFYHFRRWPSCMKQPVRRIGWQKYLKSSVTCFLRIKTVSLQILLSIAMIRSKEGISQWWGLDFFLFFLSFSRFAWFN